MKKMNWLRSSVAALALGAMVSVGTVASAQVSPTQVAGQQGEWQSQKSGGHKHGDPAQMMQKRLEHMKTKLGLSDAQVSQIQSIYQQNASKLKADFQSMKSAQKGSQQAEAARTQMKADRQAIEAQVKNVLTADQQAKMQQFEAQREQHKGKHGNRDGNREKGANENSQPAGQPSGTN